MIKSSLDTEKLKSSFINPFKASGETIKATLARYKENFRNGEYGHGRRKQSKKGAVTRRKAAAKNPKKILPSKKVAQKRRAFSERRESPS